MTIGREDLVAAAAVGLLQYRQIDPLLVFLLQRDVRARRLALAAQVRESRRGSVYSLLSYTAAVLAMVTVALFAVLFTSRAANAMSAGAVVVFAGLSLAGALGVAACLRKSGYCGRVRMLTALIMASVPLAVMTLQSIHP